TAVFRSSTCSSDHPITAPTRSVFSHQLHPRDRKIIDHFLQPWPKWSFSVQLQVPFRNRYCNPVPCRQQKMESLLFSITTEREERFTTICVREFRGTHRIWDTIGVIQSPFPELARILCRQKYRLVAVPVTVGDTTNIVPTELCTQK